MRPGRPSTRRQTCAPISERSLVGRREEFLGPPGVVDCGARDEELEAAYVCIRLAEIVCMRQHRPCDSCGHSGLAVGEVNEATREPLVQN